MLKRFVKETNIHGFDQIDRSGTFGKIVWVLMLLAGLALFGWSINDLMVSYIHQHPTSSIGSRSFDYPQLALKVIDRNGKIGFVKGGYHKIEGINPSANSLDFVKMYFDMHTTRDGNAWKQKEWKFENHEIVNALLDKGSQKAEDVIVLIQGNPKVGIPTFARNLYTPYRGIKYLIESNVTDKNSKQNKIKIIIRDCPRHYYMYAGADAVSMDAPLAEQIDCDDNLKVFITTRKYIWDDLFCNPRLAKFRGNCYASCAVEKSLEGGCSEYLGSVVSSKNTPICVTEKDVFKGMAYGTMKIEECMETCSKCDICPRPCEEFMVRWT